jgi:hypothetical protein
MTCLQTSTFSQGSESDIMWFLCTSSLSALPTRLLTPPPDNLRYTAGYCLFGFPNATAMGSSPCTTSTACGLLQASLEHGILNPSESTAYSYCSAGNGEAMDFTNFEHCIPCVSAGGDTKYLANCTFSDALLNRAVLMRVQTSWPSKPAVANSPPLACSSA